MTVVLDHRNPENILLKDAKDNRLLQAKTRNCRRRDLSLAHRLHLLDEKSK